MARHITFLGILFMNLFCLDASSQSKSPQLLKSVDIEFTYESNGKNIRKTFEGFGEDPQDGLYKPDNYDIVIKLNEGFNLDDYYLQVLIEEYIEPLNNFSIGNDKIQKGWVPVNTVYSDIASRAKKDKIVVHNPEYKLAYDTYSILYTRGAVRIVVLSQNRKTKKIAHIRREYEYPM